MSWITSIWYAALLSQVRAYSACREGRRRPQPGHGLVPERTTQRSRRRGQCPAGVNLGGMTKTPHHLSVRSRVANAAGAAARFTSRALGRGSGGMIGGEVALRISPKFLAELAAPFSSVVVAAAPGR